MFYSDSEGFMKVKTFGMSGSPLNSIHPWSQWINFDSSFAIQSHLNSFEIHRGLEMKSRILMAMPKASSH